ncbi:hypothetical protein SK128_021875, partial [Halocaridina rubra]
MPGAGCGGGYTLVTDMTPEGPVKLRVLHSPPPQPSSASVDPVPSSPLIRTHLKERRMGLILSQTPKELTSLFSSPQQSKDPQGFPPSSPSTFPLASKGQPPPNPTLCPDTGPESSYLNSQSLKDLSTADDSSITNATRTTSHRRNSSPASATTTTANSAATTTTAAAADEPSSQAITPSVDPTVSPAAILEILQATGIYPWLS